MKLKPNIRSTRNKVILALSLCLLMFCIGFGILFILINRQGDLLKESHTKSLNEICDKAIKIQSKGLNSLIYDLSSWDEMIIYLRNPTESWKKANLESITQSYDYNCVWLFNIDQQLKFHTINFKENASEQLIPKNIFADLYINHFTHFYLKTSGGILEISGATIHPTNDYNRITPPQGYLFISRLLDSAYFEDIAQITGLTINISENINQLPKKTSRSYINISKILTGYDNSPVLKLEFIKKTPGISEINHIKVLFTIFFFLLAIIVLLIFNSAYRYWINRPIKLINNILKTEDKASIEKLLAYKTEFGQIASMINNLMHQKKLLESEIDNRIKIERTLIDKEQNYKDLFENAAIGICVLNDEKISNCNQEFLNITGYASLEEIKSIPMKNLIEPLSQQTNQGNSTLWNKAFTHDRYFTIYLLQKSGKKRKVEVYSKDIKLKGQTVQQALFLDITDKDIIQSKLNQLQINLEIAQEITRMGSWEWDVKEKKLLVTSGILKITGIKSTIDQEIILNTAAQILYPEDYKKFLASIQDMIDGKISEKELELRMKSPEGSTIYLFSKSKVFRNEEKQLTAIQGIIQDITAKKIRDMALIEAKEKAEESDKLKSYFISQINHELRIPLNEIAKLSSTLSNELKKLKEKEIATSIYNSSNRLLEILNSIMALPIMQSKEVELKPEAVNLDEILAKIKNKFLDKIKNSDINLKLENRISEPVILYPGIIKQIIENLVDNALKFTTQGEIKIQTSYILKSNIEYIRIIVKDTGTGISKKYYNAIFESSQQVSEGSHVNYKGNIDTGLGIVKAYVNLLKGEILLASEENQGTEITVILPRLAINPNH